MVSARRAVLEAWSRLPPEVLTGRFTALGRSEPSTLAWKTVVIAATPPEYSRTDLQFDRAVVDEIQYSAIRDSILACADALAIASVLLDHAVRLGNARRLGDKRALFANRAFEIARTRRGDIPVEQLDSVAAEIVEWAAARLITEIDDLLRDQVTAARFERTLDAAWERGVDARTRVGTPAERDALARRLMDYLAVATFRPTAAGWMPHFTDPEVAERSWRDAVASDTAPLLIDRVKLGLDDREDHDRPALCGVAAHARPLDRPVQHRARSAAKGAQTGRYEAELGGATRIIGQAIDAAASPLGLRTPEGRAGLALGALMFMDADPDAEYSAARYASRKLERFQQLLRSSARSGHSSIDRMHHAIATAMPELWVTLHNLEFRGETALHAAEIWKRVGGAPETLVRDLKLEFVRADAANSGIAVVSLDAPTGPEPGTFDEYAEEEPDHLGDDLDAKVEFTLYCLGELDPAALEEVHRLTVEARRAFGPFDLVRDRWRGLCRRMVHARQPLGAASEAAPARFIEADDLATYAEYLGYLDRHLAA